MVVGLLTAVAGGLLYLLSLGFVGTPWLSAAILLGGRALLGGAESFVITGAVSWGLALAGPANTGRVIAWVGMAMFAALAFGAPVGTTLYALGGFTAVAVATILLPLITVLLVAPLSPVPPKRGDPSRPHEGARRRLASGIWRGIEHCRLRRDDRVQFAAVRRTRLEPALAHLQRVRDCPGGGPSLLRSHARQAGRRQGRAGLRVCRSGRSGSDLVRVHSALAAAGAALTGFGYSLVYPGLGVEAVRRAPPQSRGLAMGAYTVFLDVALGFGSPALGIARRVEGLGLGVPCQRHRRARRGRGRRLAASLIAQVRATNDKTDRRSS